MDHTKLILTSSLVPYGQTYPTYSVLFRICYVDFQVMQPENVVYKIIWAL